ncbi:unnamed protein product [Urochloa humidicola]
MPHPLLPTTRRRRQVRREAEAAAGAAGCSSLPLLFSPLFPSSPRPCAPPRRPSRTSSPSPPSWIPPPSPQSRSATPTSSPLSRTSPRQKIGVRCGRVRGGAGERRERHSTSASAPIAIGRRENSGGTAAETGSGEARAWGVLLLPIPHAQQASSLQLQPVTTNSHPIRESDHLRVQVSRKILLFYFHLFN